MYRKVIDDLKDYILKENKLTFMQILSLSVRICLAIYLPASLILCLFIILNNLL